MFQKISSKRFRSFFSVGELCRFWSNRDTLHRDTDFRTDFFAGEAAKRSCACTAVYAYDDEAAGGMMFSGCPSVRDRFSLLQ